MATAQDRVAREAAHDLMTKRIRFRKTPRKVQWSFWWPCLRCDRVMEFLVNEIQTQEKVLARCPRCSSLLEVNDHHREGRMDGGST
jgi:DNA-directed RNA polymerase subunit RPC12/RpoP